MTGLSLMHTGLDRSIDEAKKNTGRVFHGQPLALPVNGGNDDVEEIDDAEVDVIRCQPSPGLIGAVVTLASIKGSGVLAGGENAVTGILCEL